MTAEESNVAPLPSEDRAEPPTGYLVFEAHRIAALWGELPPEHFKAAVAAAKAESALRSQERVLEMRLRHDEELQRIEAEKDASVAQASTETAKLEAAASAARLRHWRHVVNVGSGVVISGAMLGVAVYALDTAAWVSAVIAGPGVFALTKIFVLRRSDPGDLNILRRSSGPPPPV